VEEVGKARRDARAQNLAGERGGRLGLQRLDEELAQLAGAAQLAAQSAQWMAAGHLVAAVRTDHEAPVCGEARAECGERVERGVVGPVQIVEEDEHRVPFAHYPERGAQRLPQRQRITVGSGLAQLWQERGQVRRERPAVREPGGMRAQETPERGDERGIGRTGLLRSAAGCEQGPAPSRCLLDEAGLTDAGLAGHKQDSALPFPRGSER